MMTQKAFAAICVVILIGTSAFAVAGGEISKSNPAEPEPDPIVWLNTDVVDNVYPTYTEQALKDNFYAYNFNGIYSKLASCSSSDAAISQFNKALSPTAYYQKVQTNVNYLFSGLEPIEGDDTGIFNLYLKTYKDKDKSDEFALVEQYLNEIEAIDTAEEFEDYVETGGSGCFRDTFTSKFVFNSKNDGKTTLMLNPGAMPWYSNWGMASEETSEAAMKAFEKILDLYFADEPEKASMYYEDLSTLSEILYESSSDESLTFTYDEAVAYCPSYPMSADLKAYKDGGCDSYTFEDSGYISKLGILAEDGYKYARAMAVYALLMDSAYRLGTDYVSIILDKEDPAPLDVIYKEMYGSTYGQYVGKYYTQIFGEPIRDSLESTADDIIDSAKTYFSSLTWISDETKGRISEKISEIKVLACGPKGEQWELLDYTDALTATSFVGLSAEMRAANEKILVEQSVMERGEYWPIILYPHTVNASYAPMANSIYLLTGFLDGKVGPDIPMEVQLGTAYTVVAHELTHGFDANGAKYGPTGILDPDWLFTEIEKKEFSDRLSALVEFLDRIEVLPGTFLNGQRVNTEVTADMGGLAIVHNMASSIDGFDYELFYQAVAHEFPQMYTYEKFMANLESDPHPSGMFRINAALMQFQEFLDYYGITEGDGMYLKDSVNPWRA